MGVRRRVLFIMATAAALAFLLIPTATAAVRIPVAPVAANPAERLLALPMEAALYEPASRCLPRARRPGTERFAAWLDANARGIFWGSYRCERWGPGSASLHAEKRAVDWHLDATRRADRRAAERLIAVLTAPDSAGNSHALARRMGVEEIIWDCHYWAAGMAAFRPYSPCLSRDGRRLPRVDPTTAHRDHIHFGLTRAGSLARTSFWLATKARPPRQPARPGCPVPRCPPRTSRPPPEEVRRSPPPSAERSRGVWGPDPMRGE